MQDSSYLDFCFLEGSLGVLYVTQIRSSIILIGEYFLSVELKTKKKRKYYNTQLNHTQQLALQKSLGSIHFLEGGGGGQNSGVGH